MKILIPHSSLPDHTPILPNIDIALALHFRILVAVDPLNTSKDEPTNHHQGRLVSLRVGFPI